MPYISWKLLESDPKSKFSNGYNSVIFKVKIYDKISSKLQKNLGRFFKKYLKISDFQKYFFSIIKNRQFSNIFKKIFPNFFLKYFCSFELARQFSMSTDFFINFYFKNDWVIAVWKFQLWISSQHKMWRGSVCAPYILQVFAK